MNKLVVMLAVLLATGCASVAALRGDSSAQVSGRTLAYEKSGGGAPTVIFESGLGDGKDKWSQVARRVRSFAPTFVYDRAGYGASSNASDTRSAVEVVGDLRALLQAAGIKPPYVLVGHSLGGLYMQYFARNFPGEVQGLVLVESSHWDQQARMARGSPCTASMVSAMVALMAPHMHAEFDGSLVAERQVRASPALTNIPAVVLTATKRNFLERGKFAETWYGLQKEMAATYHAEQVIAARSGHYIQEDEPDLVVAAVRKMLPGS